MGTSPGPATLAADCASASVSRMPVVSAPLVMPTPCRKPRREKSDLGFFFFSGSCLSLTGHLPLGRNPIDLIRRACWIGGRCELSSREKQRDRQNGRVRSKVGVGREDLPAAGECRGADQKIDARCRHALGSALV